MAIEKVLDFEKFKKPANALHTTAILCCITMLSLYVLFHYI